VSFESDLLAHLSGLIDWDREYAAEAIPWYFKTCPWLEPAIGPALRAKWSESTSRCAPSTRSTSASSGSSGPAASVTNGSTPQSHSTAPSGRRSRAS
jgi:hypothetical protein